MGNRKSLGHLITKYAVFELMYTFFIMFFLYSMLNLMVSNGFFYPANYAEKNINKIESEFENLSWSISKIPYYYEYQYIENGKVIQATIEDKYDYLVQEAIEKGKSTSNGFIGTRVFKHFTYGDRELIVSYRLTLIPTSEALYRVIGNFELFYLIVVLLVWSVGFIILIRRSTKLIKKEINKISSANFYIQQMELDYPRTTTKYTEINDVLNSLDVLARNLKKSLKEQWQMQEDQKEMIEAVTHDIRTPITLIKGNLELLKEENPTVDEERISDMEKGVLRLEVYIQKLRNYSVLASQHKSKVGEDMVVYWVDLIKTICKTNNRIFEVKQEDTSSVLLDKENIAIAIQNLVVNSIEHSGMNTKITVAFSDSEDRYSIVIKDEGSGFD